MGYIIFERKSRIAGSPTLTLNKFGRIGLNKPVALLMKKDAVEHILLLWDAELSRIGIRPITKKDARSYRVAYSPRDINAYFSAKTFMDSIGYDYSETRVFPVAWNDEQGLFEAEIPPQHLRKGKDSLPRLVKKG